MWTFPPRRILAAVDFGEASAQAVRIAGELSAAFNAPLTVLHAESFEAPPYFTPEQLTAIEEQRRSARREAERYLLHYAESLAGRPVVPVIVDGPPAAAILDAARDQDLIVMGTHGRRGPVRWWAGSVAERVARDASAPVLVVRREVATAAELFAHIAVISQGGAFDGSARRYATGLAGKFAGVSADDSARSIREAALQDATLVVLAKGGAPAAAFLSSAAEQTLRACHRPVLFVPSI